MRYKSYIYIERILLSPYLIIRRFNKCTNRGHFLITRRIMAMVDGKCHPLIYGGGTIAPVPTLRNCISQ